MSHTPIAITGMGAVCSLGIGTAAIADALNSGRHGLAPVRHLDLPWPDQVFGEVPLSSAACSTLLSKDPDTLPRSRTALLALIASREAVGGAVDEHDTVVLSASTVGGMDLTETHYAAWRTGDLREAYFAREHAVSSHTDHVARSIGSSAWRTTLCTACSSSANAIALGAQLLRSGRARRVLAGGADALCRFTAEGFMALGAMDRAPCRPFSADRAGMNLGEGAAYVVLERAYDALRAGRTPLGMLDGWSNRNDAFHQTATSARGDGPFAAMHGALSMSGMAPRDVEHINAHGTATENNDDTELNAMERLFLEVPPFVSTKALTGHTLAAAGALEAVIALLCMRNSIMPAAPVAAVPMPEHRSVPLATAVRRPIRNVLSNAFGFGGNDTALLLTSTR